MCCPISTSPSSMPRPTVLKAMRRPAAQEKTLDRIRAWRAICPDLTIRSTFIVGFPGETEEDFRLLLDWLDEAKLDRVGAFKYEPVNGARPTISALSRCPTRSRRAASSASWQAPSRSREEARQGRQAARRHCRRGRRARGQGPQQGRRAGDRRRRAYRDAPAVARRRHPNGEDRARRRLRFLGNGGLRAANRTPVDREKP